MKRHTRLVELSRRDFCALAGCAAGLAVGAGCAPGGPGVVQTGPLGAEPDADRSDPDAMDLPDARPGSPDAKPGSPDARPAPDARPGSPDARPDAMSPPDASGGTCTGGEVDVGAPSAITTTPKRYSQGFYVLRDSGGVYAVSSICTHAGATNGVSGGVFLCPRHGAQFTFNGDIISGPVSVGLDHYATCILGNGHVGVDPNTTVSQGARLNV